MPTITHYTGSATTTLTDALLTPGSGIAIDPASIVLNASAPDAVNFYDGSLAPLGIGAGLLLTSGTTPGTVNTVGWFGQDNSGVSGFANGDPNIDAVVNTVFNTQSYDATTLSFDFTVADPAATSVSFDVVFGSEEYPEWVDQFVDCAIVMVNGVNYALFNHDPAHPLSVVSANVAAGYFQDNAGNALPIEYDGVSHVLRIVAPIIPGATNHIKIGIADTGDHIYDSGMFLANFTAGTIPGSGVVATPPTTGTDSSDNLTGTAQDEYFNLKAGDDTVYAGGGDDIVVAGNGNDTVFGGSGNDQLMGGTGNDSLDGGTGTDTAVYSGASTDYVIAPLGGGFTITDNNAGPLSDGTDTLTNIELAKFSDGLFAIGADGSLAPVANPGAPPANTPGSVIVSGIATVGNTLTAAVNDPDGVPATVSYQWQVSGDNGVTWSNVGTDSDIYQVANADVGKAIQVVATYVDNGSHAESPVSAAKAIQAVGGGDLLVTLMHLDAPAGASIINTLTTLVEDAIKFGLSPNTAALAIKTVLKLPDINLQTYNSYAVLQANPHEPTALAVEKVVVEVAILTSLSDDDTATSLTLKIINAAAANQTLDLTNADDLAGILGIDITGITNPNKYPQPLKEIFDRNANIDQAGGVGGIETEWQDFLSIQDNVKSKSIADLDISVNQAPAGVATANLAVGTENVPYVVSSGDLLQGFSDPDNDTLSVSGLAADNGGVIDNGDGTFTITPNTDYTGPVELTYAVVDGQGGSTAASQLFAVTPLCFCAGTMIATPNGEVPVERLAAGDLVLTQSGQPRPVVWIGVGRVLATRGHRTAATPVIVRKSALADNVPHRELRVTKGHAFYLDGALIPIEFLVNHRSILWDDRAQEVALYHVELASHDVLLANGAPAESYRDDGNRWLFGNANSGWDLPPKQPCAAVLTGGPVVDAVWRRLLQRSGWRPGVPLTDDPDLHLLVDSERVDAIAVPGSASVFPLPAGRRAVRIASRAGVPAELGTARDPRTLGVALRRIALRQGTRFRVMEAADAALADGFHPFEADCGLRWTDGDAGLPDALFDGFDGPAELVLHVGCTTQYPLLEEAASRAAA